MGILAKITTSIKTFGGGFGSGGNSGNGNDNSSLVTGEHGIDKNLVLQPTDPTVISPTNPGNFNSIRTAPVVESPRYFTKKEADGLKKLATQTSEGARQSKRAYKSLAKIENNDAQVHRSHRRYQGNVADSELVKLRSNKKLARHLHALRPEYVGLSVGLEKAEKSADNRVNELKSKVKESF